MAPTGWSSTTSVGCAVASTAQTKSGPFESKASPLLIGASPRRLTSASRNSGESGRAFAMASS